MTIIKDSKDKNDANIPRGLISGISRKENVSRKTIHLWISKESEGESVIVRKRGQGRKRKLTEQEKREILTQVERYPFTTWLLVATWFKMMHPSRPAPSRWILKRICWRHNLRKRKARSRIAITVKHKQERLKYARERKNWTADDWKQFIFTDEKTSCSKGHFKTFVIRPKNEAYNPKYVRPNHNSGRISIHYYGYITNEGLGDIEMFNPRKQGKQEKGFNGEELLRVVPKMWSNMLDQTKHISGVKTIIHDNSRNYSTPKVQDRLRKMVRWSGYRFDSIPAKSPDFNPIEHVWSVLERKIQDKLFNYYSNYTQNPNNMILAQFVFESWDEMKKEERDKKEEGLPTFVEVLYNSMPKRMKKVIEAGGGPVNY